MKDSNISLFFFCPELISTNYLFLKLKINFFITIWISWDEINFIHNFLFPIIEAYNQAYHLSGFGMCCPGGRRDFKPDYRMSGFDSNDLSKLHFDHKIYKWMWISCAHCRYDAISYFWLTFKVLKVYVLTKEHWHKILS
jgi:hypothetical protein